MADDNIPETAAGSIVNRTMFTGDNLFVLRGIDSDSVDLIYLDPPFNSKKAWSAPIGSKAAGAAFKDTWTLSDVDKIWCDELYTGNRGLHDVIVGGAAAGGKSTMSYLIYMAPRLLEMRRVLKPEGSIYLHCDPTESHSLKLMMDVIFGRDWFRNEIIWCYKRMPSKSSSYQRMHDVILFYAPSKGSTWNNPTTDPSKNSLKTYERAAKVGYNANLKKKMVTVWDWGKYNRAVAEGRLPPDLKPVEFTGGRPPERDWWPDLPLVKGKAGTGYPTEKPLKLLERIIDASSKPGDVVLDPFAGCATAAIASEKLDRWWIGIDFSKRALELAEVRMANQLGLPASLVIHRDDIPMRTDLGDLPPYNCLENRDFLYGKQGGICPGCDNHYYQKDLHVDHIVSRLHGGSDHIENLQLLCGHCNSKKGSGTMSEFLAKQLQEK